jgi:hypothetical protein
VILHCKKKIDTGTIAIYSSLDRRSDMGADDLKRKFILDEAGLRENLEDVVNTALQYCVMDSSGRVHLKRQDLVGKIRVKIVLSAKAIANQLDASFSPELTVCELARATGLAENQARARAAEAMGEGFADSPARGSYRANPFRVAQFLKDLSKGDPK